MGKIKTSVFIDRELWIEFKKHVASRDRELSEVLEELLREELMMDLEDAVKELIGTLEVGLDFEPIKPKASLSEIVREMRDEREGDLLR